MGLFNKIFGQEDKKNTHAPITEARPCKTKQELIEMYAAIAYDKQMDFYEVIGNRAWNFDMNTGTISFENDYTFPVQIIGTFSHSSETWLWGWANEKSGIPQHLLIQSLQLKEYGAQNEIDLLRDSTFNATKNDLHLIGYIASGMFHASGYYLADYGQGILLVTIKSDEVDKIPKNDFARILSVFPQVITQFEMNHKNAFTNYVTAKGYSVTDNGDTALVIEGSNNLKAEFDNLGRLTNLTGSLGG